MAGFVTLSRFMVFVLLWIFLGACVQNTSPRLKEDSPSPLFGDTDIDNARLAVATDVALLGGFEESPLSEGTELPALSDNQSDFTAQAVLRDAAGFVYYLEHDPNNATEPFSVFRFDQRSDVNAKIYAGEREIQAVAGNGDGTIIALSMRETTSATSDFEIFRFFVDTLETQRLTDNSVDDTNISVSADGLKLVWEQSVSGKATLVLRSYRDPATLTNFQESILTRNEPQRHPSLSHDGRYIALVRDLKNGRDVVERFDTALNKYLNLAGSSTSVLEHPSISESGDKVVYLENRPNGTDLIVAKVVSSNTVQIVANSSRLEHPFLSADGLFVTYGQLENNAIKVFTKNISNNSKLRITNPASPISHTGSSWQLSAVAATPPKFIPGGESGSDQFGRAVALDSSLMVVGAPNDNGVGSAYILSRSALGVLTVVKKLIPSDGGLGDRFGEAVAISGDTVVVGAFLASHDINGDGLNERGIGAAYVFGRNQGGSDNWGEVKKVVAGGGFNTAFAFSVSLSGDTLVVGASLERNDLNGDGRTDSVGAAYVFERDLGGANNWGEAKKLLVSNRSRNIESFGFSVAISKDTIVAGAFLSDPDVDNDGFSDGNAGTAHVFERDEGGAGNWGETKELVASDAFAFDQFGFSVAISGDTVVVGATQENEFDNPNITSFVGAAYVFERDQGGSNAWGEVKKLTASDRVGIDQFGFDVAIDGDTILVAAPFKSPDSNNDGIFEIAVGAVYFFERDRGGANAWGESKKLAASDGVADDQFGLSVALSGRVGVIGALQDDNSNGVNAGAIYIDER